jgi:hypothetical protein
MTDWERILSDLMDIFDHYTEAADRAAPNSKAREQYTQYTQTITAVVGIIKDKMREEDDGK